MTKKIFFYTLMYRFRTGIFIVVVGLTPLLAFANSRTPATPAPRLRQSAVDWLDKAGDKIFGKPAGPGPGIGRGNPVVYGGRAFGIMVAIVSIVFLVRVIQAGVMWMTAQGESEKVETARRILIQSLIGLAVLFSIYAGVSVVLRFLRTSIRGPGETIQYTDSTPLTTSTSDPDVSETNGWRERGSYWNEIRCNAPIINLAGLGCDD